MATIPPLTSYAELLQQLNGELSDRITTLPPDVQALLVQKGAITQQAFSAMGAMLADCQAHLDAYDGLLQRMIHWREHFLVPLWEQCNDKKVTERVDVDDLKAIVLEFNALIGNADGLPEDLQGEIPPRA